MPRSGMGWFERDAKDYYSSALCRIRLFKIRNMRLELSSSEDRTTPAPARPAPTPPQPRRGVKSPISSQSFLVVHLWSPDPHLGPLLAVDQITVDKWNRVAVPLQGVWTFLRPHRGRLTIGRPFKAGIAYRNVRPSRSDDLMRDQTSRPQARSPRRSQNFFWFQATIGNQYEQQ